MWGPTRFPQFPDLTQSWFGTLALFRTRGKKSKILTWITVKWAKLWAGDAAYESGACFRDFQT